METGNSDALSKEALEKELSNLGMEELKQMGTRVARSMQSFEEMLDELKAEQQELRKENEHLNDTIGMMMKEMQKLNIGADNCTTPQLDENPLNAIGRWWEKVKPRDTAFQTSEHIGDIKKPVVEDGGYVNNTPQQVGKEVAQKAWGALGPLWQKTQGLVNEARGEIVKQVNEHSERHRQQQDQQQGLREKREKKERKERRAANGDANAAAAAPPVPEAATAAAASSSAPPPQADAAPDATAAATATAAASTPAAAPAEAEERAEGAEEQIAATILIEAKIKIDDGSTQTLQMRATDRCKEVSQRFIAEHSLKAWFQEPLTQWLKQVEADAVKYPVEVEADLMEIKEQFKKK